MSRDSVLAYQAGVGLGYRVNSVLTVGLQYRLFGTSKAKFNDGVDRVEADYMSDNVMAGVMVRF